jgi:hypothetical protein
MKDFTKPIRHADKPDDDKHGQSLADAFRALDQAVANEKLSKPPR